MIYPQGVALGWMVVGLSGRWKVVLGFMGLMGFVGLMGW